MKYALAIIMLLAVSAGSAMADQGQVSKDMLADFGLSSVQVMSDVQGDQIRGKGFAAVGGVGVAYVHGGASVNGYLAAGRYFAYGNNYSFAQNSYGYWAEAGGNSKAIAY